MCCGGLHVFPICLTVVTISTFCMTYIVSVSRNDVAVFFPFISDTGTLPPESCLFSFFLNVSTILSYCTLFIRFRQIKLWEGNDRSIRICNVVAFVFGILSTIGLALVANFQERAVYSVHITGAAMTICSGIIYMFLQSVISYKTLSETRNVCMCRLRFSMAIASTLFATLFLIGTLIAEWQTHTPDELHWKKEDGGFKAHVMAAFCEWLTCVTFVFFFATFTQEFKRTTLDISFHINEPNIGIRI